MTQVYSGLLLRILRMLGLPSGLNKEETQKDGFVLG